MLIKCHGFTQVRKTVCYHGHKFTGSRHAPEFCAIPKNDKFQQLPGHGNLVPNSKAGSNRRWQRAVAKAAREIRRRTGGEVCYYPGFELALALAGEHPPPPPPASPTHGVYAATTVSMVTACASFRIPPGMGSGCTMIFQGRACRHLLTMTRNDAACC